MPNALIEAVKQGDRAKVEEIVTANAGQAASVDDNGVSAILTAIYHGEREIAALLSQHAPTMTMHEAAALGDMPTLRALARYPDTLGSFSPDGWTPLHLAAAFGGDDAVEFLLGQNGVNVNERSRNALGNTALHACAAISKSKHAAKLMIDRGADVNAVQAGGFTPLHAAAFNGDLPFVRVLLDAGARHDVKTDDGQTALDLARERGHEAVIKELEAAQLDLRSL